MAEEVANTSIPISIPTTGLVMGLWIKQKFLLEFSVLDKLDIPPRYNQVGQGGEALHTVQGTAEVGPLHGNGLNLKIQN